MSTAAARKPESRTPEGRFVPGQSGNPGGVYRGLKELQRAVIDYHGPKVIAALQALYDIGMDASEHGKTRVAALDVFVKHVKGAPQAPKDDETPVADEGQLLERVADSLVKAHPEMVAAKLALALVPKP